MPNNDRHDYDVYTHVLHQDDDLKQKKRIERLAKKYDRIRRGDIRGNEKETYLDLCNACLGGYFYVTGADLKGKTIDSILIEVLQDCIRKYDSKRDDANLVHYITRKYPLRVRDEGRRLKREAARVESLDVRLDDESRDARMADATSVPGTHWGRRGEPVAAFVELGCDEPDATADDEEEEGTYIRLLTKITDFLNTRDDLRNRTDSKLYRRMVFTERVTYHVKSQPLFLGCRAVQQNERDTFACMELGFLDSFMVEVVRTVLALYEGGMRNDYADRIARLAQRMIEFEEGAIDNPPRINWLPSEAYLSYLRDAYDKNLTTGVPVSQQRLRFDSMRDDVESEVDNMRDELFRVADMVRIR